MISKFELPKSQLEMILTNKIACKTYL